MLTEEALIFLVALGAIGLVVLGTLELLWPTRPRHPVRPATPVPAAPSPPPRAVRPAPAAPATPAPRTIGAAPGVAPVPTVPVAPPAPRRWRSNRPRHAVAGSREAYSRRSAKPEDAAAPLRAGAPPARPPFTLASLIRPPEPPEPPPLATPLLELAAPAAAMLEPDAVAPVAPATAPVGAPAAPATPPAPERAAEVAAASEASEAAVDRCFQLYQAHRYADVVALASATLGDGAPPASRPSGAHEVAALWSVLALAQQALGEHAAARGALEAAIVTAPEADRPTYRRQLSALALGVAQSLVVAADTQAAPDSEGRVIALHDALAWLEHGLAAAPGDMALRELAATAEVRLWPAYEQVVMALVQRQEFGDARRLLRAALEHPRLPATRAVAFRELFSGTYAGEIGQLTAQAIRSMQEARETEALGSLQRAERLLETIHDEALPPKRREEVDRRLWWGYNKLGLRRVEAGEFEEALEPLIRALRLAGTAPDRQSETRAALVQAFEGWTEERALAIREVADAGDREAAMVQSDRLWTRLHGALQEGLSERDLAGAFARARRLVEEIGRERQ